MTTIAADAAASVAQTHAHRGNVGQMNEARAKTVLKEAVDAVVNSFAKHTHGYGRGKPKSMHVFVGWTKKKKKSSSECNKTIRKSQCLVLFALLLSLLYGHMIVG